MPELGRKVRRLLPAQQVDRMYKHRLYLPALRAGTQQLTPDRSHYLIRVLRLRPGDWFVGFDGSGHQWAARVARLNRDGVHIELGGELQAAPESPLRILLAQAIARGERMDYALQKATELGVHQFQPLLTARTEVRLGGPRQERRLAHWRGVVIAACEQSGRTRIPAIAAPRRLEEWLAAALPGAGSAFVLAAGGDRLRDLQATSPVTLLVGPEGGLTDGEIDCASRAGLKPLSLGPRTLRCETAGTAAIAAVQSLWGDMG